MYQNDSDIYEQRCSISKYYKNKSFIVELDDSVIDTDSRELHSSKQQVIYPNDANKKKFIEYRIQYLQDQIRSNQQQQIYQQDIYFQEDPTFISNKKIKQNSFQNLLNGKQIRNCQLSNQNEINNYNNRYCFDVNQSTQMRSLDIIQNEVEKRISMRPDLQNDEDYQIEKSSQIQSEINAEEQNQRDQCSKSNIKSSNNEDYEEEQYDYINEQEYERMMQEIEGRDTKGRISSNLLENYQLFKPSFHEEILKYNNQGKNIASFSKRNESNNEQQIKNIQEQDFPIDSSTLYPQNFSTFNQNNYDEARNISELTNIEKKESYSNEVYTISNSAFNQKTVSQFCNSDRSDPNQDAQNNTFQTTFFQNSFQQNQQSQQNTSQVDKKYLNMPLQQNLFYDELDLLTQQIKEKDNQQKSFENERFSPSNLVGINRSNKKEKQRYEDQENLENINDEQRCRQYSAHVSSNNQNIQKQIEYKQNQQGYQPTKFTQFFLGSTSNISNLESTENTGISLDQPNSQKNNLSYRQPAQSVHQPSSNACSTQLPYFHDQNSLQLIQKYLRTPLQPITSGHINEIKENQINYQSKPASKPNIQQQQNRELKEKQQQPIFMKTQIQQENKDMFFEKYNTNFNQNNDVHQQIFNSFSQNVVGESKTDRSYFDDISERNKIFYDKSKIITNIEINMNDQYCLNERTSSQIIERILSQNSQKPINCANIQTGQHHLISQVNNDDNKYINSPFQNHFFSDQQNHAGHSNIQLSKQNHQYQKQTTDNKNEQCNKQNIRFNMRIESYQNDSQSKHYQDNLLQNQEANQPQNKQKQYDRVENKLLIINQSKQSSFHQNAPTKNNPDTPQTHKYAGIKKQPQSQSPQHHIKQKNPIENRLLLKSKEREIQKQEKQKNSYIQANEKMKKHKISSKSKELAQKIEQNGSIYERNQRFLKEKEQKQLQLKEEQVKSEIQYSFSPHIRPQSQNLVRNVNDLMTWKENLNQKNIEMRNQQMKNISIYRLNQQNIKIQVYEELKEIETLQKEKLICKGSEKILQNSSRIHVKQRVEEKLINSGLKYQQHREELDKLYNSNPTKNQPLMNKKSFKLLLNPKKRSQLAEIQKQTYNQDCNSPRIQLSSRNESLNSRNKISNQHSSTNSTSTQNYTLSNTNSSQVYSLKDTYFQQGQSMKSQNPINNYSDNLYTQQTLSAQQSKSQSFLVCNQNQKLKNKWTGEEQEIQSDQSIEKIRSLSHQKYYGADLTNSISTKNIPENQLKIKNIRNSQQKQKEIDQRQITNDIWMSNNEYHNGYDNISDFNSPKVQDKSNTHRYYTNESLKKSYEMRQNYIQQKSRDNSKQQKNNNNNNNNRINSNSQKRNKK